MTRRQATGVAVGLTALVALCAISVAIGARATARTDQLRFCGRV